MERALLFDIYGVLMRDDRSDTLAAIEAAAGQSGDKFWEAFWHYREFQDRGTYSDEQFWAAVAERTGVPIRDLPGVIDADVNGWLEEKPDMARYFQDLIADGVRVGVLSNLPTTFAARLEQVQPWLLAADPLLFSGRIGHIKPEFAAFSMAVEAFGLAPQAVMLIDDREVNIASAREFGMATHLFTGLDALRPAVQAHLGH